MPGEGGGVVGAEGEGGAVGVGAGPFILKREWKRKAVITDIIILLIVQGKIKPEHWQPAF